MNTSILKDLGLTNAEITVYLTLLEIGESKAGQILKKSGLYNSVVHAALHSLAKKGFLSFVTKGQIKHYTAADPEFIIQYIEEKKEKAKEMLPLLKAKQAPINPQSAEVFSDFRGFKVMMNRVIENAKKSDEYLFFAFFTPEEEPFQEIYDYYQDFEKEMTRRGVILKGIAPRERKHLFKKRNLKNILFVDFPTLNNMHIFQDRVVFTPWEFGKTSFLIHSQQLANSFKEHFYAIWNEYKK